jgi:hypothetical protein
MRCPHRAAAHARCNLAWGVVCFLVLQATSIALVDGWHPELYDPEYGLRLALVRVRRAEQPGRPLLLFLGSSRTVLSFRPEVLPLLGPPHRPALVFNFSHCGAGPLMNLMLLERLLRDGMRPDWLVVELLPPKLFRDNPTLPIATAAAARDLPLLHRYVPTWKVYGRYLAERIVAHHRSQLGLVGEYVSEVAAPLDLRAQLALDRQGGCSCLVPEINDSERERQRMLCWSQWSWLREERQVCHDSDRATRALLDLCRRERIRVALVLSPESRDFQDLYSPEGRAALDRYVADLREEYGVPVIDARDWLADRAFMDGHHVLMPGADAFTLRLGRDVLQPLVEGNLAGEP